MHRAIFRGFRVGKWRGNLTVMSNREKNACYIWLQMRFSIEALIKVSSPEADFTIPELLSAPRLIQ